MRRKVVTISALLLLAFSDIFPKDRKDDSYIIRKAYIDTLGVFPTLEEIDWYCTYNSNGYQAAVDYLTSKTNKDPDKLKAWLLSEEYLQEEKAQLSRQELERAICYFAGEKYSNSIADIKKAKLIFLRYAKQSAINDLDTIDYMACQLMSRATRLDEANRLLNCLRTNSEKFSEEETWLIVLDELLKLEDVRNK